MFGGRRGRNTGMDALMTATEVAGLLKVSKHSVYELAKERTRSGDMREKPLPCVRIGSLVRFRRSAVEAWLAGLE
jgi:predicted DNA-binding transcriptional regulator AlpA